MIKAIETVYNGYRFRSRLEARWAVCLDALGWTWEYEPEGYSLPSGCYLPDFLIRGGERKGSNDPQLWLEIKPTTLSEESREAALLRELAHHTSVPAVCGIGLPDAFSLSNGLPGWATSALRTAAIEGIAMNTAPN
jgi:hypothetical protein